MCCEILAVNCVESCKVSHISQEASCLDSLLKTCAGLCKDSVKVLHNLLCLSCDVAACDLACGRVYRDLTGSEEEIANGNSLGLWADSSRGVLGFDFLKHNFCSFMLVFN